jgi:hypothetical protein
VSILSSFESIKANDVGVAISMQELLNDLLTDDVLDDGYVCLHIVLTHYNAN